MFTLNSDCAPGMQPHRCYLHWRQLRGYTVGLSYNFESPRVGNEAFHQSFASALSFANLLQAALAIASSLRHCGKTFQTRLECSGE